MFLAVFFTGCLKVEPADNAIWLPIGSRAELPTETENIERYLIAIEQSESFGFDREDFQYSALRDGLRAPDEEFVNMLEDSFRTFVRALIRGRVEPRALGPGWERSESAKSLDTAGLMRRFFAGERIDYDSLNPQDVRFTRLVRALSKYRELALGGGWPELPKHPTVEELAHRLRIEGDLEEESTEKEAVLEALARFQRRHGLEPDGVIGKQTLEALNIPIAERVRQIELNLERWRWMPSVLESNYVEMNIPTFQLTVFEQQRPVFTTKAIVGTPARPSPVLHSNISAVEVNPNWNVPESIASRELLPLLKRNPSYALQNHMIILDEEGNEAPPPRSWESYSAQNFPFRIRQVPGPWNSVGPIKFVFANGYGVYLHGTPAKNLFNKVSRRFSHGCVRLEDPLGLAANVFAGSEWTRANLQQLLDSGMTKTIALPNPVSLYLTYWTAQGNEDGTVLFADDIYEGDSKLDRAIKRWHHQRLALYHTRT